MHDIIDRYMNQEQMHSLDGRRGLIALAKMARVLGYKDEMYSGQLASGACLGDITNMLEDNPGMIEAMIKWIGEQRNSEWKEAFRKEVHVDDEEDD